MKTILIVDDQADIREILIFALKENNYQVLEADSVDQALKLFTTEQIDMVITDYLMPHKNGADLIRELRSMGSMPPVFIITGYSECPRQELIDLKVQATIFKPFDPEEVALQVAVVLK